QRRCDAKCISLKQCCRTDRKPTSRRRFRRISMFRFITYLAIGMALFLAGPLSAGAQQPKAYPAVPKKPVTQLYHGVKVADYYRWLEDKKDPAVRKWIDEENSLTRAHLDRITALKPLRTRLEKLLADPSPSYDGLQLVAGT